ncbi:MAG: amino acid permease [Runella slithyformis]|nr:MAG: amino acid permease [Runella slithyformis]TAE99179.1 MAG: amino acid permease [Runella slithyformis]TAF29098.1 MAG: amino acid permease [Runella slithyformis]TAF48708.1 MAG: amino acid permease [Runella slithyformis]TAF79729.1 MAG: amino acid permease [Runella slithyformis]
MSKSLFRRKDINKVLQDAQSNGKEHSLVKVLGLTDLTSFGIAAIIGAGIFSTIGNASFNGGPAVALLFVFIAMACAFTGLCYAQFASTVPVSGSAYTYAYVSFGEIFAWIIGWALILEYAVSNMVVAIGWSGYFTEMLSKFGILFPEYFSTDYVTARNAALEYEAAARNGTTAQLSLFTMQQKEAFDTAPTIAGLKMLMNIPAFVVTAIITSVVYVGIKESRNASNALVVFKVIVILVVIVTGAFFINTDNWTPFFPNGVGGVLLGVSSVFFAFVGFDSISTTAEECKDPQRDMPRAMLYALAICTVLYVVIALVLTGMVNYKELKVDDPLAYVFSVLGLSATGGVKTFLNAMGGIIAVSAVVAMTSALLAYQIGQPRIWMTMSRDGLIWKKFSEIHPKYKTPAFATLITGLFVGVPSLFLNMQFVTDLTSVGTLFAFIVVCAGILYMDSKGLGKNARFRVPYINSKYAVGGLLVGALLIASQYGFVELLQSKPLLGVFWAVWIGLAVLSFQRNFSLIPVLGILTNLYLMTELGVSNWLIFLVWLGIGLVIYFSYGYWKSKLATK